MTPHYPDLGSASDWLKRAGTSFQPIRSTTNIWVVTPHQYGISALVTQTSFCEGSSGDLAKRRLFSQANFSDFQIFHALHFLISSDLQIAKGSRSFQNEQFIVCLWKTQSISASYKIAPKHSATSGILFTIILPSYYDCTESLN